jgi:hypothetical protein
VVRDGAATAPSSGEASTGVSRLEGRRCLSPGDAVRQPAAGLLDGVPPALYGKVRMYSTGTFVIDTSNKKRSVLSILQVPVQVVR